MAIASTPLNSDGIDPQSALQRRTPVPGVRGARAAGAAGESSYISNISATGFAMLALDNFQASAENLKNAGGFRTARYLQTVVQGVANSLNGLRDILEKASALRNRYSAGISQALSALNKTLNGDSIDLPSLQSIGVTKDDDGRFSVNTNQVTKAFGEDSSKAFSTIADFAYKVSKAPEPPEKILGKAVEPVPETSGNGADDTETINTNLQQRLREAFAAATSGYTAIKAVNLYETVEAI